VTTANLQPANAWCANTGIDVASTKVIFGQIPQRKQLLVNASVEIRSEKLSQVAAQGG
jgi:hypothetical protein